MNQAAIRRYGSRRAVGMLLDLHSDLNPVL